MISMYCLLICRFDPRRGHDYVARGRGCGGRGTGPGARLRPHDSDGQLIEALAESETEVLLAAVVEQRQVISGKHFGCRPGAVSCGSQAKDREERSRPEACIFSDWRPIALLFRHHALLPVCRYHSYTCFFSCCVKLRRNYLFDQLSDFTFSNVSRYS